MLIPKTHYDSLTEMIFRAFFTQNHQKLELKVSSGILKLKNLFFQKFFTSFVVLFLLNVLKVLEKKLSRKFQLIENLLLKRILIHTQYFDKK